MRRRRSVSASSEAVKWKGRMDLSSADARDFAGVELMTGTLSSAAKTVSPHARTVNKAKPNAIAAAAARRPRRASDHEFADMILLLRERVSEAASRTGLPFKDNERQRWGIAGRRCRLRGRRSNARSDRTATGPA